MNTQLINRERLFAKINFSNSPSSASNSKVEDDNGLSDVEGKVKTRLLSMWNNVKYGKFTQI